MQEPLIEKVLNLAKFTFARQPSSKRGCRQRILEPVAFSDHVSELVNLVKQVSNKAFYIFFTHTLHFNIPGVYICLYLYFTLT